MRDFYKVYENDQTLLRLAMKIGWTLNVVIMEAELTRAQRISCLQRAAAERLSKKKLLEILNKNNVNEILFPDGLATLEDFQVEDTEPDSTKPNNTIISIEKAGYRRNGRLLRLAEVIVVKN